MEVKKGESRAKLEHEVDIVDVVEETVTKHKAKETPLDEKFEQINCITDQINDQKIVITEKQSDSNKKFIITDEERTEIETSRTVAIDEFEFLDSSSVKLLQGAVTELERALRDSRVLMKSRDEAIVELRKEVEKGREQVHKEQMKWQRKSAVVEERNRDMKDLKRKLADLERSNEELQERIKEFESPFSESDGVSSCCSSMKELIEVKLELAERDLLLSELRENNCPEGDGKAVATKWGTGPSVRTTSEECERHNQLKLKFLRDAFFYFMIDFHSEEQMKAILAVLAYGDQREVVITQAFRMRQRGKKFSVKEVSSRGLSFLHEEI